MRDEDIRQIINLYIGCDLKWKKELISVRQSILDFA